MRTAPPPWPGAPLPTDLALLGALRDGGRLPRLLESLPGALLIDQFRRAGAKLPEHPGRKALKSALPKVRRHVEQAAGAQDLLTTWSAVFLPAFLAAPEEGDMGTWRSAVLCRVGAMTLGDPPPAAVLIQAADEVIAGRSKRMDGSMVRAWWRWFGLRDVAVQAEGLAKRVERTLSDVRIQLESLNGPGTSPLADWQTFEDALQTIVNRRDSLDHVVDSTVKRLRAHCERLDLRPPEPLDLRAVADLARGALGDLGPAPTPAPALPLHHLVERLDPPPSDRDRAILAAEAATLHDAVDPHRAAPLLAALARVLVEDRVPRTDEQLLFEEHLSGRFCRQLAGGNVSLREAPVFAPVGSPRDERRGALGDGRASPFTVSQVNRLRAEGHGVVLVVGSPALGIERVWPALQAAHTKGGPNERCWQIGASHGTHATIDQIRDARRASRGQGLRPVVRRTGMPVAEYLLTIQLAVDWLRHVERSGGFVRVTFIVGPAALFALRREGVLGRLEGQPDVDVVRLRRWREAGLRSTPEGPPPKDIEHVMRRTGGWPNLVEFMRTDGLDARWPAGTLGDVGLRVHPSTASVLQTLADTGPLSTDELEERLSEAGLRPRHARALISYLVDLDLVTGAADALEVEPIAAASLPDLRVI